MWLTCSNFRNYTVLHIGNHEELGAKIITLKSASISLHDSLAALVRHSQAQKCNPKAFQTVFMEVLKISVK